MSDTKFKRHSRVTPSDASLRPRPPAPVAPKVGGAGKAAGSRLGGRVAPWLLMLDGPAANEGEDAALEAILGSGPMGPMEVQGPQEQMGPGNHQGIMEEFAAHDAPPAKKMNSLQELREFVKGQQLKQAIEDKLKYEDRVDERLKLRGR